MPIDHKSFANIQESITKITAPIEQLQQQYQKSLEPLQKIQSQFNDTVLAQLAQINQQALAPYQDLCEKVAQAISSMGKSCDFSSVSSASAAVISAMASLPYDHADLAENANDYITINEAPIKELDISETIAIPVGNNRIRMKASDFIALLLAIHTALFTLLGFVFDRIEAASANQSTQQLIEVKQEENVINSQQNQILLEWLDSIDTSKCSNSDAIENLILSIEGVTECLQALESAPQESDFAPVEDDPVPGQDSENVDNSLE